MSISQILKIFNELGAIELIQGLKWGLHPANPLLNLWRYR